MKTKKDHGQMNLKCWGDALMQTNKEKAIYKYFEQYYGKSKQLQQAIDNLNQTNNSKLLLYGLETLYIFSKSQNMNYMFYIKQILNSANFKKTIFQELDYLENKYKPYHRIINKVEEDKKFINYFIKFVEEYTKIFFEHIQEYLQKFHETVNFIKWYSSQFEYEEKKLQELLQKVNNDIQEKEQEIENENQIILRDQFEQFNIEQNNFKFKFEQIFGEIGNAQSLLIEKQNVLSDSSNDSYVQVKKRIQKRQFMNVNSKFPRMGYLYNYSITYKSISILPTTSELTLSNTSYIDQVYGGSIFDVQKNEPTTIAAFLNNNFFILREDCYQGMRKAIQSLKQTEFEKIDQIVFDNINLYYSVLIEDVKATNHGLKFKISMKSSFLKRKNLDLGQAKFLMSGSLIILTTTSLNFMIFCKVANNELKIFQDRISLYVKIFDLNSIEQLRAIQALIYQGENTYAIENKVFYESYYYYLQCLQSKSNLQFPFEQQLMKKTKEIPIFEPPNNTYYLYQSKYKKINNVSDLLDESQQKAINQLLTKGISLIQGPPGTGKTHCGALGVKMILENNTQLDTFQIQQKFDFDFKGKYFKKEKDYEREASEPMLILCQTNHALDQFLRHILQFCHQSRIVRLGNNCSDPELEEIFLKNYSQAVRIKQDWKEFYQLRNTAESYSSKILNLQYILNGSDLYHFFPQIADKILQEYLHNEGLQFTGISFESKNLIFSHWFDNQIPNSNLKQVIIDNEFYRSNNKKRNQRQAMTQKNIFKEFQDDLNQFEVPYNNTKQQVEDFNEFFQKEVLTDSEQNNKEQKNLFIDEDEEQQKKLFSCQSQSFQEVLYRTKNFIKDDFMNLFEKEQQRFIDLENEQRRERYFKSLYHQRKAFCFRIKNLVYFIGL